MTMRLVAGASHRGFWFVEREWLVGSVVLLGFFPEAAKRTFSAEISLCRAIEYRSFVFLFVLSPLGDSADVENLDCERSVPLGMSQEFQRLTILLSV